MRTWNSLFCPLILAFFFNGCGSNAEGPENSLPTPVLLPPPSDYSADESGIDTVPEADAIQVQWQKYPGEEARLIVHRSDKMTAPFKKIASVSAKDTTYLDETVAIGVRYWYFITAKLDERNESRSSDTLSYKLLEKPFALTQTSSRKPRFRWQVQETPLEYVLKLFDASSDKKVWFASVPPNYGSLAEEAVFNFDGSASVDSLQSGRPYRWRVDVIAPEQNSGAESNWRVFVCP